MSGNVKWIVGSRGLFWDFVESLIGEAICEMGCRSWIFSVMGALLAIPVGIKRKSLGPLVFFGSTGAMLDIVQGFADCERQRIEKERAAEQLFGESSSPSGELVFKEDGETSNFANR